MIFAVTHDRFEEVGMASLVVVTPVVIPTQVVRISESTVRCWKIVPLMMRLTPDDVHISVDTADILRPCGWDLTVAVCEIFSDLDKIIQGRSIY